MEVFGSGQSIRNHVRAESGAICIALKQSIMHVDMVTLNLPCKIRPFLKFQQAISHWM